MRACECKFARPANLVSHSLLYCFSSTTEAENYLTTTVKGKTVCLGAQKGKKNLIKLGACKDDPRYKWYATEDNFSSGKDCKKCISANGDGTAKLVKCKTSLASVTIDGVDTDKTGKCPGAVPPTPPAPPKPECMCTSLSLSRTCSSAKLLSLHLSLGTPSRPSRSPPRAQRTLSLSLASFSVVVLLSFS